MPLPINAETRIGCHAGVDPAILSGGLRLRLGAGFCRDPVGKFGLAANGRSGNTRSREEPTQNKS